MDLQLAGRDRRHRGAVRGAVGQSGRRQEAGAAGPGARAALGRRLGEDVGAVGFDGRRRQWHRRAPPGRRRSNGEVEGIFCSSVFCACAVFQGRRYATGAVRAVPFFLVMYSTLAVSKWPVGGV